MHRPNHLGSAIIIIAALLLLSAGPVSAEYLGNISFDHALSSFLPHDTQVTVSIDYKIDDPAGRRIYVIPYSGGAPAPGYGVSGSAVYPAGTGTTTKFFTITTGEVIVDEVRVYFRDPDFTETPLEIFVPAAFQFGPHGVFNIQPSTTEYSRLKHGMDLEVDFDFEVDAPSCRIYARPWSGSHLVPGYSASGSMLLPPSGSYSQHFAFDDDADITHIRFQVVSEDQQTLYAEFFYPFRCAWREWGVYDIEFNYGNTTSLHNDQQLVSSFVFDHDNAAGVRVWTLAFQDGNYCPGGVYQPSALVLPGDDPVTRYCRVATGSEIVDHVHFVVGQSDDTYMTFDVPLRVHYGPHAIQNIEFIPGQPAILSYGEHLDMTFDYVTDEGAGVRIYGRAAYEESGLFGMTSAGSPLYPAPNGGGDFWLTYNDDTTANSVRFQMVSEDQSVLFLEWFEPGWFIWAGSGTILEAPETPAAEVLGAVYPNPFNPTATVPVNLQADSQVRLTVYDLRGRLVDTLHQGQLMAGKHAFTLRGDGLSSGAYICRLETSDGEFTRRVTLVK